MRQSLIGPALRVAFASLWLTAAIACSSATKPAAMPSASPVMESFSSNGCSGFREARLFSCCYMHDLTFWAGGSRPERRRADLDFRLCALDITHGLVVSNGGYFFLWLSYQANNIARGIVDDGWGRAWRGTGRAKYEALTAGQREAVAAERQRVCRDLRLNPATGHYRVDDSNNPDRELWPQQAKKICGGDPPRVPSAR